MLNKKQSQTLKHEISHLYLTQADAPIRRYANQLEKRLPPYNWKAAGCGKKISKYMYMHLYVGQT